MGDRIRSNQKISSYIIIPTAHHHHRKLFGVFQGSYQNSVKSIPPLIYHAKSKYALKKWKGRLPSYLGNEGSYQKTVKGIPSLIYHAESNYALEKWKGRPEHSHHHHHKLFKMKKMTFLRASP